MKTYLSVIFSFCILLFCATQTSVAQDFEGIIHYEIPEMTQQGMGQMPYMVKGNKVRMELNRGQQKGVMLFMPEQSKTVILIDQMNGYMTMDTETRDDINTGKDGNATQTGQTKTIAGKNCKVWKIESDGKTMEVCMAKGMGSFMMPKSPMSKGSQPDWAKKLMANEAMPLEVIAITDEGKSTKMKAVKIEEKSLSADLFKIPDGYKDMSGMMNPNQN
ncbi:protein of unknown function (DUF4412) [Fodinibius salinus]|uniref:DUF4412 domain-containing protein n=1 Tax=Fodinibius salinus TaxID=860790 RepID=A0A5D3YM72_9BACT|nr:DUF4412 domain-containing protein [Fodinibius salinus]TYP94036.1 protein of unknown function (DUF4412) [Fodinibius salinus]